LLLTIDIGNTNIVAGVFAGDSLVAHWRFSTESRRTADEFAVVLDTVLRMCNLQQAEIDGVVMCSVVPAVLAMVQEALSKYWQQSAMVISPELDLGIEVRYSPAQAVGADRVANAVAALGRYGAPAIVVDFGTTTNFDVVSPDGAYIGGVIAPGLEISEEALYRNTAQLRRAPLVPPPTAIGSSTAGALQSGILFGYAGLVDGLVERVQAELGSHACVIATGGLAQTVAPLSRTVEHIDTFLTLHGLYLLYEQNRPHANR
jgi:type III pantothenate kinase